jgi:hypothetical protein
MPYIPIHCAVTDCINGVLILIANVIQRLTKLNHDFNSQCYAAPLIINNTVTDGGDIFSANSDDSENDDNDDAELDNAAFVNNSSFLPACSLDSQNNIPNVAAVNKADAEKLAFEQRSNITLKSCHRLADKNEGDFHL